MNSSQVEDRNKTGPGDFVDDKIKEGDDFRLNNEDDEAENTEDNTENNTEDNIVSGVSVF